MHFLAWGSYIRITIGVYWRRRLRPIEWHQCRILTFQYFILFVFTCGAVNYGCCTSSALLFFLFKYFLRYHRVWYMEFYDVPGNYFQYKGRCKNKKFSQLKAHIFWIENLWSWMNYIFLVRTSQRIRLTRKVLISFEKKGTSISMLCAQDAAQCETKKNKINNHRGFVHCKCFQLW
jgi:hypothetical protein